MTIQDLKESLDYLFEAELTAFVWGHAGLGKSTVVKQYAEKKGYKFFPFYLGTMSDTGDILGLAEFTARGDGSKSTDFAPPGWLLDMVDYCNQNPDSGAIIFLDEFNRGRRDILNGMFSLALDKTFHTMKLPKNCHIVAAGNPPTDEYNVTDVNETALMARFVHIKLEPTVQEWMAYAKAGAFEPTLVSFIQDQPDLLEDQKSTFDLPVKVDRRSYERLNRLFKLGTPSHILYQLMAGIIGMERLVAYKAHCQNAEKPLTGTQVLNGEKSELVKQWSDTSNVQAAYLTATCDNVMAELAELDKAEKELTETQVENLVKFYETLPLEVSFSTLRKAATQQLRCFKALHTNDRLIAVAKVALGAAPKVEEAA